MTNTNTQTTDLPAGWKQCLLSEFCELIMGQSPPSSTYNRDKRGLPFYQGKTEFGEIYPTPKIYCDAPVKIAEKDDVLISVRAPVGPTNIAPHKACIGRGLAAIRPIGTIPTKFILYLFRNYEPSISKQGTGTTFKAITKDFLAKYTFPLPPLAEQHRIVAKIEELFSDLDHSVAALEKAREQFKTYRQAVLKYAFEGKLTEKWRQAHSPPSAADLLARIQAERAKSGKPAKLLSPLTKAELAELPSLPEGWVWVKVGDLTLGVEYGSSAKSKKEGRIPVLRMGNIQDCRLDWSDLVYSDNEEEIQKYLLQKHDVLFNRTNSPELVGKTAIYLGERPAIFAGYLIKVNQIRSLVNAKYLNYFLNCIIAKNYGNRLKTDGVNQSDINGQKLMNYPFPYSSLKEQHAIVEEIEARLSVVDKLEETIETSLQQAEALRQSILKQAFAGKLVPQDPVDEPAGKLLERIKEANAKGATVARDAKE